MIVTQIWDTYEYKIIIKCRFHQDSTVEMIPDFIGHGGCGRRAAKRLNSDCLLSFWPLWMSKQGDVIDQLGRVVKLFTHPQKPFVFLFFPIICLASWDIAKQAFSIYLLMYIPPICYFRGQSMNISMTSLFAHKVAQPTKLRFLPKNLSQLVIFVIELGFT